MSHIILSFFCVVQKFVQNYTHLHICMLVPGEPRRVRLDAVNSTAVHVQWRPPLEREQNGVIRGYQVLYMRIDEREEGIGGTRVYDVMGGQYIQLHTVTLFHLSVALDVGQIFSLVQIVFALEMHFGSVHSVVFCHLSTLTEHSN